jgi:peptidoglycan/LPS O-acetylase OafA/YrhL
MSQHHRQPLIDIMKVVAAQFIFFHHAALYGPLSDAWHASEPVLADWLASYGLMAVQVFLVVAGFLSAQSLSRGHALHPLLFIARRFERLARPLWFVLFLTLALTALARPWLTGDMLPKSPEWPQLFAHIFLLQNALGFESLSAGVWYTAVDFQLYVIMVWLILIAKKLQRPWVWPGLVALIAVVSAFWFNRHAQWDASGFYFFGSYGLGALVYWARASYRGRWLCGAVVVCMMAALWVDWRVRLCVAMLTAGFLWVGIGWRGAGRVFSRVFASLNESTYLFFLLNFPMLILANVFWLMLGDSFELDASNCILGCWVWTLATSHGLHLGLPWLSGATALHELKKSN